MKKKLIALLMAVLPVAANAQKATNHNFEVAKNLDLFNAIYKNLDLMYVDTLNPAEVIGNGINAMLRSLDPYTEYFPADKTKELKMLLTGKYAGIGSRDTLPPKAEARGDRRALPGNARRRGGMRKGDIILSIDDSVMTDKTVSQVSENLRGEPGTSFMLKVRQPATGKDMTFKIKRKSIKLPELPYYGMRPEAWDT